MNIDSGYLILKQLSDYLKFILINYFSRHICPERFSLSSEEAKKNNFYEVHIYIPKLDNPHRINFEFIPNQNSARWGYILAGRKKVRGEEFTDCLLSYDNLRFSRIDVSYYYKGWEVREQKCSLYILFKLCLLKSIKAIYLSILTHQISKYYSKVKVLKRLRTPLKSKFEIYESLMNNGDFLQHGTFKKSELAKSLFGNNYVGQLNEYLKISKSLDWILESCEEDGEIQKISPNNTQDPMYKMKGKGIHYFTLTKESIKNDESSRVIQEQQVMIQRRMVWLTFLLVIGTFLATIDKIDKAKELLEPYLMSLFPYVEWVQSKFI